MDIYSTTWQVAVEAAGIWPSAVDLGPRRTVYVFTYHRWDGEDRVLTVDRATCMFSRPEEVAAFINGSHSGVPLDVHLALEVLGALSPEGLDPAKFPATTWSSRPSGSQGGGCSPPKGRRSGCSTPWPSSTTGTTRCGRSA